MKTKSYSINLFANCKSEVFFALVLVIDLSLNRKVFLVFMLNGYFKILELHPTQDMELIKSAYKKLATRYHPDKNLQNIEWAEERFKLVSEAYRLILEQMDEAGAIKIDNTSFYHPAHYKDFESKIPHYWDTIRNSKEPVDQVKLILHELEEQNDKAALKRYDQLASEMLAIDPLSLLEAKHYFDACLLLGEALEAALRYEDAVKYYAIYYQHNRILLHKRQFAEELKKKILQIYKLKICKNKEAQIAIKNYLRLLGQISFTNQEKAKLLKELVKLNIKVKNKAEALRLVDEVLRLDPKLKSMDKLVAKINVMESL